MKSTSKRKRNPSNKNKKTGVSFDPAHIERADLLAGEMGVNRSEIIGNAIEFLTRHYKNQALIDYTRQVSLVFDIAQAINRDQLREALFDCLGGRNHKIIEISPEGATKYVEFIELCNEFGQYDKVWNEAARQVAGVVTEYNHYSFIHISSLAMCYDMIRNLPKGSKIEYLHKRYAQTMSDMEDRVVDVLFQASFGLAFMAYFYIAEKVYERCLPIDLKREQYHINKTMPSNWEDVPHSQVRRFLETMDWPLSDTHPQWREPADLSFQKPKWPWLRRLV